MTFFDYLVLAMLSEQPDRTARMSELAGLANGSLSRLSHVARRLEARGYLHRQPDPTDGRFTQALLTNEGWRAVEAAAPGHVRMVRELVFTELDLGRHAALKEACWRILDAVDPSAARLLAQLSGVYPPGR
ncbi:MAG: MarR family transcriptional regulator [Nocardioidaceae bacterium]